MVFSRRIAIGLEDIKKVIELTMDVAANGELRGRRYVDIDK